MALEEVVEGPADVEAAVVVVGAPFLERVWYCSWVSIPVLDSIWVKIRNNKIKIIY